MTRLLKVLGLSFLITYASLLPSVFRRVMKDSSVRRHTFRRLLLPGILLIKGTLWARDQSTVRQRLKQYGGRARARLKPYFDRANVPYPPAKVVLLGIKNDSTLEVYAAGQNGNLKFIRAYPILAASGMLGPKIRQGDGQVPEGIYRIESLNPNSAYHLSMRVNYPNAYDRERAKEDGRWFLGGDIMIHGNRVSIGCLAMGDPASEDLFVLSADTGLSQIKVILSPVDFRKNIPGRQLPKDPPWVKDLYQQLRRELQALPKVSDT